MKCFIYVEIYVVQTVKFDIILTFHIHISHIDNTTDFYLSSALAMKICGCIVFSDLYRQKEVCSSALLNKIHIYMKNPQFYAVCCISYAVKFCATAVTPPIFYCIRSVLLSLGPIFFLCLTEHISSATISFYLQQCNSSKKKSFLKSLRKWCLM